MDNRNTFLCFHFFPGEFEREFRDAQIQGGSGQGLRGIPPNELNRRVTCIEAGDADEHEISYSVALIDKIEMS